MAQQLWDTARSTAWPLTSRHCRPPSRSATVRGKAKRGEAAYASCAACHGADAAGNAELGAPPLRALDDWYVVEQLNAFRVGLRGSHSDDTAGQLMRAAAGTLTGETVAVDIAAYITTLRDDAASEPQAR